MAYTVRTPEGSLDFASLTDVARAYRAGLVEPEDELREGMGPWVKAGTHPVLRSEAPRRKTDWSAHAPFLLAAALSLAAFVSLAMGNWVLALLLAAVASAMLMRRKNRDRLLFRGPALRTYEAKK